MYAMDVVIYFRETASSTLHCIPYFLGYYYFGALKSARIQVEGGRYSRPDTIFLSLLKRVWQGKMNSLEIPSTVR